MYDRLYNSFCQQQRYKFDARIPLATSTFGKPYLGPTNCVVCDFTGNTREHLATEWCPTYVATPDPPLIIQTPTIYYRHIGQVPSYGGHIPGEQFRFGKTYGNDTKDAKRWLRGDFS